MFNRKIRFEIKNINEKIYHTEFGMDAACRVLELKIKLIMDHLEIEFQESPRMKIVKKLKIKK